MELEFYQELILSAVFSVLFAFLIGKITGAGFEEGNRAVDDAVSYDLAGAASVEETWGRSAEEAEAVSEQEIAGGNEGSEGKSAEADEIGAEEGTTDEMPEAVDIGRNSVSLFNEVEGKGGEKDTTGFYSEVEDFCGEGVGIRGAEEVSVEKDGGSLLHGEDEWEGIERSELEKLFGAAMEYVGSPSGAEALTRLSSNVQMELYGLHKVATEGPCYESQPFPLMVSARARWHAWQKLSSMTPEVAMEQYISVLSKCIPGWIVDNSGEDAKHNKDDDYPEAVISNRGNSVINSIFKNQLSSGTQRKLEERTYIETETTSGGLKLLEQGVTGTFLLNVSFPTRGAFFNLYW